MSDFKPSIFKEEWSLRVHKYLQYTGFIFYSRKSICMDLSPYYKSVGDYLMKHLEHLLTRVQFFTSEKFVGACKTTVPHCTHAKCKFLIQMMASAAFFKFFSLEQGI